MRKIIKNLDINYTKEGKGKTILMLHGWGSDLHTFDEITNKLSKNHEVVRFDFPGFGNSQTPKKDWNLENYVNFTKSFIDEMNIKPEIILGHSFGGRVIIKGSAQEILHSEKNILISSAGIYKGNKPKNMLTKITAKLGKLLTLIPPFIFWREKIRKIFYQKIDSDYYDAGPMSKTFINIIKEDLKKYAKNIKTPTLLIWGENDNVTPVKDGKILKSLIKNSKLKTIKKSSHFVHKEKPSEVVKIIKEFNE